MSTTASYNLRIKVQHNFSTTRAILSFAKKDSPDEKIFILLKELITDAMGQDDVRVRTKHSASQGTMRMPGEDVQRTSVWVPLEPALEKIKPASFWQF